MKTLPSLPLHLSLLTAAFWAAAPSSPAAGEPPAIAKSAARDLVTITDGTTSFTLSNGTVTARIAKRNGDLESLVYNSLETMGHEQGRAGYWEQDPAAAAKVGGLTQAITVDPAKNGGERGEISIRGVTKGDPKAALSPGSPGAGAAGTANLDMEIRYSLGRGDSGLYVYAIYSHPEELRSPCGCPRAGSSPRSTRPSIGFRSTPTATCWPAPPEIGAPASSSMLRSSGYLIAGDIQKFRRTQIQLHRRAIQDSRLRMVEYEKAYRPVVHQSRAIEYLSGGASKQELVCHSRRERQPRPDHPQLLARHPLQRRRRAATCRPARRGRRWSAPCSST